MLAILLEKELDKEIDILKVLKMLIVHDLAEAVTGDIPSFETSIRKDDKYDNELKALGLITESLSNELGNEIIELWQEFEARGSAESKFANSLDKIEVVMQHNLSDINYWGPGDFAVHPYYKNEYFDFDKYMRAFKDYVDVQSMNKIIDAGMTDRIDPKHLDRFHSGS